jgi:hypothetical protein
MTCGIEKSSDPHVCQHITRRSCIMNRGHNAFGLRRYAKEIGIMALAIVVSLVSSSRLNAQDVAPSPAKVKDTTTAKDSTTRGEDCNDLVANAFISIMAKEFKRATGMQTQVTKACVGRSSATPTSPKSSKDSVAKDSVAKDSVAKDSVTERSSAGRPWSLPTRQPPSCASAYLSAISMRAVASRTRS